MRAGFAGLGEVLVEIGLVCGFNLNSARWANADIFGIWAWSRACCGVFAFYCCAMRGLMGLLFFIPGCCTLRMDVGVFIAFYRIESNDESRRGCLSGHSLALFS